MKEVKKVVDEYVVKRDKDIEKQRGLIKTLIGIKDSVKDGKEFYLPQDLIPDKIEETAKLLSEYFGQIPEKAFVCYAAISMQLLPLVKLEKVATFNTEITSSFKLPSIYLADYKGHKLFIVDILQEGEDKYLELFPTLSMRVLILTGVKKFIMMAEVSGVDPDIKLGEVMLFENYIPINVISPLIGKYCKKWSEQFLDVAAIFNKERNEAVKKAFDNILPITSKNVAWVNSIKTYVDIAELKLGQGLRVPVITTQGMIQSLVAFDMKKEFITLGIIKQNLNSHTILSNTERKAIIEKLIDTLTTKY